MSKYFAVVLVSSDTAQEDAEKEAAALLAPFDLNRPVPEYQSFCWCKFDRTPPSPAPGCSECHGSGICPSDFNWFWKWDWWRRDDSCLPHPFPRAIELQRDFSVWAVLTPEGVWWDREDAGNPASDEWTQMVRDILAPWPDCYVLGFVMHC